MRLATLRQKLRRRLLHRLRTTTVQSHFYNIWGDVLEETLPEDLRSVELLIGQIEEEDPFFVERRIPDDAEYDWAGRREVLFHYLFGELSDFVDSICHSEVTISVRMRPDGYDVQSIRHDKPCAPQHF
jgi:hypothetical protein